MVSKNRQIIDAKLDNNKLKSIDFGTIVDALCEGQIEGSATASKAGITDKSSVAYTNAFLKDLFLNRIPVLQADADNTNPDESEFNYPIEDLIFEFQDGTENNQVLFAAESQNEEVITGDKGKVASNPEGSPPVPRSGIINEADTDTVQVKVRFDSFFKINKKNGNRNATRVRVIIKVNPNNGGPITVVDKEIKGKSFNPYNRDFGINLRKLAGYNTNTAPTSGAFFPITVTLERGNQDGNQNTFNVMRLAEIRRIIREPNNYPNIAYTALRFSSEIFQNTPARFFRIRGKLVKIPAEGSAISATYTITGTTVTIQKNAHGLLLNDGIIFDATSGAGVDGTYTISSVASDGNSFTFEDPDYSGGNVTTSNCTYKPNPYVDIANGRIVYPNNFTFNGTLRSSKVWTSDPAWVLFDLLTDTRSGCGLPESDLDPFTFYGVSTYCSALVDDADGGQEPRFSINANINNRRNAMSLIKDICSVMRALPYYEEGAIKIAQDAPSDQANPSAVSFDYVFNNANVTKEGFTYSGSSVKTRFNVINVSYFDLISQEIDYVTVKDEASQNNYGTQLKTITTFGTTSRGQAQRVGKWFLQTQQNQTETVIFETNIAAGSILRIGDIIGIADRVKSATRRGGLVKSATNNQIIIDSTTTNLPIIDLNPTVSCMLPDGTVETKNINSYSLGDTAINVSSNFSQVPVENSPFLIEHGTFDAQSFRVVNIKENPRKTFTITAVEHNAGKYAAVEDGTQLPTKNFTILTELLPPPKIIDFEDGTKAIQEIIVLNNNRPVPKLFIDWENVEGASGYQLIYTKDDENPIVINTQQSEVEILPSEAGSYFIEIYTINSNGERSALPTQTTVEAVGLTEPPENPTNFQLEPISNSQVKLTWDKTTSLDVEFGGKCIIRHTPNTSLSASFANSTDLNDNVAGNLTEVIAPALTGTYSIKFVDLGDRKSNTEAKVQLALPQMEDELQLLKFDSGTSQLVDFRENPTFSGTKTNLQVVSSELRLADPSNSLTGSYNFLIDVTGNNPELDFGTVFTNIRLKRHIKTQGFLVSDQFDLIPDLDLRGNFDGVGSDLLKSALQVQTSQDNSSFTTAQNLTNGSFSARSFKFTANLISEDVNENISFQELGIDVFLPSRTENKYQSGSSIISTPIDSTNSASGKAVVFGNPFFTGTSIIGGSTTKFLPSITIAPENMPQGAFYTLSNISGTGFTIIFKDSSQNPIDVKFTFQALGYGKGA